ncbi:aldehyde dehydrogenase family protein [Streptomyces scopuliridis]|uniref:Aldehyde dehydrogenase family protein n=1 Tax=Streptomyces scopuliridis TaxID=452529 RepID=A0ACD4ZQV2_9ACTN|nr:aldehyde dehydrogenase family protein [Streptomyces scopuliridis]WSC00779.1 aldehyde dehydrogenase family protein [Streptomyces scopuliridis]WSC05610.1 aldehyde dehydrogenase family protein [Streptomyces scopuliridis]
MTPLPPPRVTATPLLGGPLPAAALHALATRGSGPVSEVRSLLTDRPAATVPHSTPADVFAAIATATDAQRVWARRPERDRRAALARLDRWIARHRTYLGELLAHGSGLCGTDTADELRAAERALRPGRRSVPPRVRELPRTRGVPHARGVPRVRELPRRRPATTVATHTDDSRPLASLLEAAVPALLDGSAVLSHVSPRAAVLAARLCAAAVAAGLPAGIWRLVIAPPGSPTAAVLDEHAETVIPPCCPAPCPGAPRPGLLVVRHDARLRTAVAQAGRACFSRAGQGCTAAPIVAVHDTHHATFQRRLANLAAHLPAGGAPGARSSALSSLPGSGPCADFARFARSIAHDARLHPVLTGGHRPDLAPYVHEPVVARTAPGPGPGPLPDPALLAAIPPGPLALIVRYTHWSDVLALAHHTGRHATLITNGRSAHLAAQFAGLPADDIR